MKPSLLFSESKKISSSVYSSNSLTYSPKRKFSKAMSLRKMASGRGSILSAGGPSDIDIEVDQIALVNNKQLGKITDNLSKLCASLCNSEESNPLEHEEVLSPCFPNVAAIQVNIAEAKRKDERQKIERQNKRKVLPFEQMVSDRNSHDNHQIAS